MPRQTGRLSPALRHPSFVRPRARLSYSPSSTPRTACLTNCISSSFENSPPTTKILIVMLFPTRNELSCAPDEIAAWELPAISCVFPAYSEPPQQKETAEVLLRQDHQHA